MRNEENRFSIISAAMVGMMVSLGFLMILAGVHGQGYYDGNPGDTYFDAELMNNAGAKAFIENGGQWDEEIDFAAETSFGHVALGDDFILYDVIGPAVDAEYIGAVFRMDLMGSNPVKPQGADPLPYKTNIILGNDPDGWGTDLGSYRSIVYTDLWDDIDLVFDTSGDRLKYEYIVRPGADPDNIRFRIEGATDVSIRGPSIEVRSENAVSLTDGGLISFYEESPEKVLASSFELNEDGSYGYKISGWDGKSPLVIDPFIYSTYIGGTSEEYNINMDRDANGNIYLCGETPSRDFPVTPGAYSTRINLEIDGWVMKLNSDGSGPVFSTFIGGSKYEALKDIKVDSKGDIYVGGMTSSPDFPTTRGAFNETLFGRYNDLIAFKLDSTGSRLSYSTYIGGNGTDEFYKSSMIQLDDRGCLYITGTSMSSDYPVTDDAYDKFNNVTSGGHEEDRTRDMIPPGGGKAVVTKLDPTGTDLEYSTFLGGEGTDRSYGISLEDGGNVYIMGYTSSRDFPVTKGAYRTSFTSWDSEYITKLDTVNSKLVYSTYFGTDNWEDYNDITHDSSGRVIITGGTVSSSWPVSDDAYCRSNKGFMDVFVTALDQKGSKIAFSTLVGGEKEDLAYSISLDGSENIYITGSTMSKDYPRTIGDKYPYVDWDSDVFITVLNQTCSQLIYSTIVGGTIAMYSPGDTGHAIIYSGEKEVVVAGSTACTDFPVTEDAMDNKLGGDQDVFFFKFDLCRFPDQIHEISIEQGNGFLNVTWEVPLDDGGRPILGYSIYRGELEAVIEHHTNITDGNFFNDADLDIGETYYYTVRAFNEIGEGPFSRIVSSEAVSAPTIPQFFQIFSNDGWVKISWEPPVFDGALPMQGYRVYRYDQTNDTNKVFEIPLADQDLHDTDVVNGHNYTYSVTVWNSIGESDHTTSKWIIPKGTTSPPVDLKVQNGPGFAHLTWSYPENDGGDPILHYRVYQGTILDDDIIWRYMDSYETEFNDTLVDIGSRYVYYVTAVNTMGESIPSETVEAVPQAHPSPPSNIQVSEGNRYVTLTWNTPDFLGGLDVSGYRVYRADGDQERLLIMELDHTARIHKDKDLVNGKTYHYQLTAFNEYGESDLSGEFSGTPATVTSKPIGSDAQAGNSEIVISWTAPSDNGGSPILGHVILRKEADGDFVEIAEVQSETTTFTDTEIQPGATYTYKIQTKNRMGLSLAGEEVSVVAQGPPGPPDGLVIVAGDGSVTLSWSAPIMNGGSEITGYIIYKADPELESLLILDQVGADVTTFEDTQVTNGERYIYMVTSINALGESLSEWSEPVQPLGTPGAPASMVIKTEGDDIILSWSAPADDGGCCIEFYRIYRTSEDGERTEIALVVASKLSFVDTSLKQGGKYTYSIVAVNDVGDGNTGAQDTIDIKDTKAEGNPISDNIGLVITVPIILVLLVLLIFLFTRRNRSVQNVEPTPAAPIEDQYPDMSGYFNGYPEQEQMDAGGQPPQLNNVQDYEQ